jgi:omega-6 fatty acid desaturase (delta-12 desaturase)
MKAMDPNAQKAPSAAEQITLPVLRNAIPAEFFIPSPLFSGCYIVRDLLMAGGLAGLAFTVIPTLDSAILRWSAWIAYGYLQGLIFTGIWILAHECGHQALFRCKGTNDTLGFMLHSLVLVPYFSWKYTHARHHMYTNHMERDTAFVPRRSGEPNFASRIWEADHENDVPILTLAIAMHQLIGWPMYLFFYSTGGPLSAADRGPIGKALHSHFDPTSRLFTKSEQPFVLLSALGVAGVLIALYTVSASIGAANVLLLYGVPYLWVNNWLVAITYLHHTHTDVHHYEASTWTYLKGALGTVDRPFGFIGEHLFHGIIDYHVIHHLFP